MFELAIALAIASLLIVYGMRYWSHQTRMDMARNVGRQFSTVNAAMGNYLALHYSQLQLIDPSCSRIGFAVGSAPALASGADCGMTVTALDANRRPSGDRYTVPNALQPTVADLIALGLLPSGTLDEPGFQARRTVIGPSGIERYRFGLLLWHVCAQPSAQTALPQPSPNTALDTPSCETGTRDLASLVYNTQPFFADETSTDQTAMLGEAMTSAGGDAAMSTHLSRGELAGARGAFLLRNPVRDGALGATAMLAVRNGYGAAGWLQFTRRDGSAPPTADWDFNDRRITNLNSLEVTQKLRIPDRRLGQSCSASDESIAISQGETALLACLNGVWSYGRGKGVNPAIYRDFVIASKGDDPFDIDTGLPPGQWGMPTIIGMTPDVLEVRDATCHFMAGPANVAVTTAGVGIGDFFPPVIYVAVASAGVGIGTAEVWCPLKEPLRYYTRAIYPVSQSTRYAFTDTGSTWRISGAFSPTGTAVSVQAPEDPDPARNVPGEAPGGTRRPGALVARFYQLYQ